MLARLWIAAARLRRRLSRVRGRDDRPRERLVATHVPGRSFADVGCMWGVDGAIAFAAEQAGATEVTGVDLMEPTPAYLAERARRKSQVRFVQGDLHDAATLDQVGRHDVVWCSGVVYHAPHPLLTIQRLAAITGDTLILASETIPEIPGLPQACVFYPGLDGRARKALAGGRQGALVGLTSPFQPQGGYANWYWGLTRSALTAMLQTTGLRVTEQHGGSLHATLVARRIL